MFDIHSSSINRLIIHRIVPKTPKVAAYAVYGDILCELNSTAELELKERFAFALNKSNKTFKLEIDNIADESFFVNAMSLKSVSNDDFITTSKKIADSLASSHHRTNIPGGFIILLDGFTNMDKHFVAVIKAEYQKAFTVTENSLQLLEDIFLSPAKDFYKIGILVEEINLGKTTPNDSYSCFMYDDQYSQQNSDLTEYFYSEFLGFTTDRNDKFLNKRFYEQADGFFAENIDNIDDRIGLKDALKTLYREEVTGIISPSEFSNKYLEGNIKEKFDKSVTKNFPVPFVKDMSLIDKKMKLDRISIPLNYQLKLEGKSDTIKTHSKIINVKDGSFDNLITSINTGEWEQIIMIGTIAPKNDLFS